MKEIEEAIIFYESHLLEEIVEECKAETNDEKVYVGMLIEKYKESSNYTHHKELNTKTKNKDKLK